LLLELAKHSGQKPAPISSSAMVKWQYRQRNLFLISGSSSKAL